MLSLAWNVEGCEVLLFPLSGMGFCFGREQGSRGFGTLKWRI